MDIMEDEEKKNDMCNISFLKYLKMAQGTKHILFFIVNSLTIEEEKKNRIILFLHI